MTTRKIRQRTSNQEEAKADNRTNKAEARGHRTLVMNMNGKHFLKSIREGNKV